ncbi:MAG: HU family DNA-binding protein [Nitrospira sp.]
MAGVEVVGRAAEVRFPYRGESEVPHGLLTARDGRAAAPAFRRCERGSDMTKAQIIEQVSEKVTTLTKRQAEVVVNTIFDCIRDSLKNGDKTEIRGFGSFRLRARRMKEGRNPKTGATVAVPAKRVPFFKAGKELKELLNQPQS